MQTGVAPPNSPSNASEANALPQALSSTHTLNDNLPNTVEICENGKEKINKAVISLNL
jgi:hypothetical protein